MTTETTVVFTERLANRILGNPNALAKFPALKPYARIRNKAVVARTKSCCQGAVNEREITQGVKQFIMSASKAEIDSIKAYMGLPAGSSLRLHSAAPGQKTRTVIL